MKKLKQVQPSFITDNVIATMAKTMTEKKLKDRFLVRLGNHIHSIKIEDISLFYAEGRTVYLVTIENKKFILDYKLEDLEELLDSRIFYRVNRSFIININEIKDVMVFSNSRLKITTTSVADKEIIVSRERVAEFKKWFEGV